MHSIAPTEKYVASTSLEKRLWDAACDLEAAIARNVAEILQK
jgi:hypothetical protein